MIQEPILTIGDLIADRGLVQLAPTSTAREAAMLMAQRSVGAVAVIEGEELVGIFTERDLLTRVVAVGREPDHVALAEVMTRQPQTVDSRRSLVHGLSLMLANRHRHLPVFDNGRVVGMLSCRDVPTDYFLLYENWIASVGPERAVRLAAG